MVNLYFKCSLCQMSRPESLAGEEFEAIRSKTAAHEKGIQFKTDIKYIFFNLTRFYFCLNRVRHFTYPLQVSLEFVPGISGLPDPGVEGVVHAVELVPHLVGACTQSAVDLSSQTLRSGTLLLGTSDVLLGISHPGVRDRDATNR